jgi:hypothetical protein
MADIVAKQPHPVLTLRSWAINEDILAAIIAHCKDVANEMHGESDVSDIWQTIREVESMQRYIAYGKFELKE